MLAASLSASIARCVAEMRGDIGAMFLPTGNGDIIAVVVDLMGS